MKNRERSSALEKALAVLQAICDRPYAVGLPDLVAQLELPRATLHRVLSSAVDSGLLLRDPARERYAVGPRLSKLAWSALASPNQGAPIRAIVAQLVQDLGESCNVGVLDGMHYFDLFRLECPWPLRFHLAPGSRLSAHCIAGGKMLLAQLEPANLEFLLNGSKLERCTSRTITRSSELKAELARIRARGFAVSDQELMDGVIGVAVPVRDQQGRTIAALSAHGPKARLSLKRCESYVPRLRRTAKRLARVWLPPDV